MYVELVERKISNRGHIVPLGTVNTQPANHERYISLFPYDHSIQKHIALAGSVRGYKGVHYCPAVMIDIDHEKDLQSALNSTRQIVERFYNEHGLHPEDLSIAFSGNKGFHIGIYIQSLGDYTPATNIPQQVKSFVSQITEGIDNIDKVIYDGARLFRIQNSINPKSKRYKIPLHADELQLTIGEIIALANKPRTGFIRSKPVSDIRVNESLQLIWHKSLKEHDIKAPSDDTKTNIFTIPGKGTRNNTLFRQACHLFDKSELTYSEIQELLNIINDACQEPLPEKELNNLIKSAALKTKHKNTSLELRPVAGWLPEWYDSLREEKNRITLGFSAFDAEMRSRLRGKLCVILGKGGTKKSLFAQNLAYRNLEHARTIYSSMEMGSVGIVGRGIDMAVDIPEFSVNATHYLEEKEKRSPGYARQQLETNFSLPYSDKLLITQNTSLTTPEYYILVDRAEAQYGAVDMLIIDGLSMMGGKGTETELVNRHTKELKQLAIDKNILIVLIVHVTKEGEKTTRDLSKLARGSEKIIDNSDFYLSMSLIKKISLTDEEKFEEEYGVIRLVNKRGSGNCIDQVYRFNKKRLLFEETGKDMQDFV